MLKNKRILVTAGPTWTAVDRVRVLTSVFSGETGLRIARHLCAANDVTLLMGPGRARYEAEDFQRMRVRQFFYYEELAELLRADELAAYDAIIHSSAVSDFRSKSPHAGKMSSAQGLTLELEPTAKLVDEIRLRAPHSCLVKFKLQVGLTQEELLAIARQSLAQSSAQLLVANNLDEMAGEQHQTYIVRPDGSHEPCSTKEALCLALDRQLEGLLS